MTAAATVPSSVLAALPRGDVLLRYQQQVLREVSHAALIVIEKSRRIGLTWALAAHAVTAASARKNAGGKDVLYISYSHEMTREFIDACAMWAKAFMHVVSDTSEFLFDDQDPEKPGDTRAIKAFRISFASGFEIVALSSAPRSIRGKQGLVILDEAAFVDNLAELLKAALALLMWGGQVVIVSTHDGVDNPFNLLLDDIRTGKRRGATMRITFADAIADGLYERVCLMTGKEATPEGKREWEDGIRASYGEDADEELDCIPKTGSGAFLPPEHLAACEHSDAGKPALYGKGLVVIGRDVARRRDLAVIWPFEIVGNTLWLRERWEKAKATFAEQDEAFDRMFRDYRVLRANIDQTGMGEKVVEDQQRLKGTDRVHGVLFTAPNRLDMANALKKRVEEHTIVWPPDPAIRVDMRAIKKMKGAGDNVRLANDDTVHADMFWAAALACLAAGDDGPTCRGYRAATRAGGMFGYENAANNDGRMRMRPDETTQAQRRFVKGPW